MKIVCQVGLPSTGVDYLQRGGRCIRVGNEQALYVTFYEPWVNAIDINEFATGDLTDPDRPRIELKPNSSVKDRAPYFMVKMAQESSLCCRGANGIAGYLNDTTAQSTSYTTSICCLKTGGEGSPHPFPVGFSLASLLPGPLFDPQATTDEDIVLKATVRNKYRPTMERPQFEFYLNEWLTDVTNNDPLSFCRPPHLILSNAQRTTLIKTKAADITSPESITSILQESKDWDDEWAGKIYDVFMKFQLEFTRYQGVTKEIDEARKREEASRKKEEEKQRKDEERRIRDEEKQEERRRKEEEKQEERRKKEEEKRRKEEEKQEEKRRKEEEKRKREDEKRRKEEEREEEKRKKEEEKIKKDEEKRKRKGPDDEDRRAKRPRRSTRLVQN